MRHLIISIGEIWLKGRNQKNFMYELRTQVRYLARAFHQDEFNLYNLNKLMILESTGRDFSQELLNALLRVAGIHAIFKAHKCPVDYEKLSSFLLDELLKDKLTDTYRFRFTVIRSNKNFPMRSDETAKNLGHEVLKKAPHWIVDLRHPEIEILVRILDDGIYVGLSGDRILGIGGLPIGSNGKALTLLSGGIDSPVASFLMAKRGLEQEFIFFHAYPFVGDEVKDKIIKLAKYLALYQKNPRLFIVPFGDFQMQISKICKESYRTLLFRKFMIDVSTLVAQKTKAEVLITGDALGQVSSQTLVNLQAINLTANPLMPVLRPLIGFNKDEIVEVAREIGTYEISIIPHNDACSLIAPKHPVINPDLDYWQAFTKEHQLLDEVQKCVDNIQTIYLKRIL